MSESRWSGTTADEIEPLGPATKTESSISEEQAEENRKHDDAVKHALDEKTEDGV